MMDVQELSFLNISDLLVTWGLSEYSPKFEEQGIDMEVLPSLLEEKWQSVVEALITTAGHRIKFLKHLGDWVNLMNNNVSKLSTEENEDFNTSLSVIQVLDTPSKKRPSPSTDGAASDEKRIALEQHQPSHSRSNEPLSADYSVSLQNLLGLTASGRVLLAHAKKCGALKQERDRLKLAEIIIEDKLGKSNKINAQEFSELAAGIKSLFPQEDTELYYIPYIKDPNTGKKHIAKGKLISKYYNLRKDFKALGIISQEAKDENGDPIDQINADVVQKLKFLEQNCEPWPTISQYWLETSEVRIASLKTKKDGGSVAGYTGRFPALKEKLGYTLLEADFDQQYPECNLKIYSELPTFCDKAIRAFNAQSKKTPALLDTLQLLEDESLSQDDKALLVLLNLCHLDTVITVARSGKSKKGKAWRPSHPELQEGLISQIEAVGKLEGFVKHRREKLASWGLTTQPFVVVCGKAVDEIDASYVVLDNVQYLINSPQRAIDVCFKIIHAVNAEYSTESQRLWMLLQKELYGMSTVHDRKDANLTLLLQKFRQS